MKTFLAVFLACVFLLPVLLEGKVRSIVILSDNIPLAELAIRKSAEEYGASQIQLSHNIIHDLREIRRPKVRENVARLAKCAHSNGVKEVLAWDHNLYGLDYYPKEFRSAEGGRIDLDNSEFWEWFKNDYREMMSNAPDIDGIVLTFIETGARVEAQHSSKMKTPAEKLAKAVNEIADVVIGEMNKKLYIRTFAYSQQEYRNIVGCIGKLKYPEIILMVKETPHDFFLTHPDNPLVAKLNRPMVVEFDLGNEYSGQGVIANTWVEPQARRMKNFLKNKNVIGYAARIDRYGDTSIFDTPNEIQLFALDKSLDGDADADSLYGEFIAKNYGKKSVSLLKPAFKNALDIVKSSLYTLGTNTADHSRLNYAENQWAYNRHVSGRWLNPPEVFVGGAVNKKFRYWEDVVNKISPVRYKKRGSIYEREIKDVFENGLIEECERMDWDVFCDIVSEKTHAVNLAKESLRLVESAKPYLKEADYGEIHSLFLRTYLAASLHAEVCKAYFGARLYSRGGEFRSENLEHTVETAAKEIARLAKEIKEFEEPYPKGQYDWRGDANGALRHKDMALSIIRGSEN